MIYNSNREALYYLGKLMLLTVTFCLILDNSNTNPADLTNNNGIITLNNGKQW